MKKSVTKLAIQIEKVLEAHEAENYVLLVKDPDSDDDCEFWGNDNWAEGAMHRALRSIDETQRKVIRTWLSDAQD